MTDFEKRLAKLNKGALLHILTHVIRAQEVERLIKETRFFQGPGTGTMPCYDCQHIAISLGLEEKAPA